MHKRDWVATGSWIAIGAAVWLLAWIIAEAIPVFNNLLSLIASLFASWFTCKFPVPFDYHDYDGQLTYDTDGFSAIFWLHMNKGQYFASPTKILLTCVNIFIIGIACCIVSFRLPLLKILD